MTNNLLLKKKIDTYASIFIEERCVAYVSFLRKNSYVSISTPKKPPRYIISVFLLTKTEL